MITLKKINYENTSLFIELSTQISNLAGHFNINIIPFKDSRLHYFSALDDVNQKSILNSLKTYLTIYTNSIVLINNNLSIDSSKLIWCALKSLGYRPTSDIFSFIEQGNVIEIHNHNFVQVFRNLNFFRFCSYTLEELYCFQITDLYERNLELEKSLMSEVSKIYSGTIKTTVQTDLPAHIIQEKMSDKKLKVFNHIKYISPLYSLENTTGSQPCATFAIEQVEMAKEADKVILNNQPNNIIQLFS